MVAGISGGKTCASESDDMCRIKSHTKALLRIATLCAVYDTDRRRGMSFSAKHSVAYYDDIHAMINEEKFDGAIVVNPDSAVASYAPLVITTALINAKKHVFLEWPISYDAVKCMSLLRLATRRKVVLECGRMWLTDGAVVDVIRDITLQKRYGRLLAVHVYRQGNRNRYDATCDTGLCDPNDVCQDTSYVEYVHDVYLANWIIGGDVPHVVFARAGDAQRDTVIDESSDGGSKQDGDAIKSDCSDARDCKPDSNNNGTAALSSLYTMIGYTEGKTAIISSNMTTLDDNLRLEVHFERAIIRPDLTSGKIAVCDDTGMSNDTVLCGPDARYDDHIFSSIHEFVGCIDARKKGESFVPVHIGDAVSSLKVAKAALLSGRTGIPIYLDLRLQQ